MTRAAFAVALLLAAATEARAQRGERIAVPPGLGYTPPMDVYRGDGRPLGAVTTFDPTTRDTLRAEVTYYVDIARGDNSNDGRTPATAFRSLWRALQGEGHRRVVVAPGRYDLPDGWRDARPRGDLTILGPADGPPAVITTHLPLPAAPLGDGRYRVEVPPGEDLAWGNVADEAQPLGRRVLVRRDTAAVGPGEFFADGRVLVFRLADGRAPDADVLTLVSHGSLHPKVEGSVFLRNLEFKGGRYGIEARIPPDAVGTFDRVTARYSHGEGSVGFLLGVGGELILHRCAGFNNYSDDFNWKDYHAHGVRTGGAGVEVHCVSRYAGQNNAVTSTNATTAHGRVRLVRINGDYRFAQNRVVADVDDARTWNVACVAQGSRYTGPKRVWSQNWSFAGRVTAWIDQCQGSNVGDTSARGWSAEGQAQVYHHACDIDRGDNHFTTPPLPLSP